MHDSYTGCVSEVLTAEENPAACVSITPSLPLCCMKSGKQRESIPLNLPPTQSPRAGFSDTLLVGNKGVEVRGTLNLLLKRPQS